MRKTIIILMMTAAFVMLSSCSKFLEEHNKTQYSTEYLLSSTEGVELMVNALYPYHRACKLNVDSEKYNAATFGTRRGTDIAITNGNTGNYFGIYDPNTLKPNQALIRDYWKAAYILIGRCNEIIAVAETLEDSERLRTAVAEAKCFRAEVYFTIFRLFDRILLSVKAANWQNIDDKWEYRPAKAEEVYELLYSDLEYAIANLDWLSYQPGRFNKAAAYHLLGRVAMWKGDYETALDCVEKIDESQKYRLCTTTEEVFGSADLNHSEGLLVQQWSRNVGGNLSTSNPSGNHIHSVFVSAIFKSIGGDDTESCCRENGGKGLGIILANSYLLGLYDQTKDTRYKDWYILQYINPKSEPVQYGSVWVQPGEYFPTRKNGSVDSNNLPSCTKFIDSWNTSVTDRKGFKDIILYRLAEDYITGAEAALRLNETEKALRFYNKTWMRAGNDEFTGTLTMQHIIDEQARELAFEGERYYFLKRLGILISQVQAHAGEEGLSASLKGRTNLPANPHMVRWPIPEAEVINMGVYNFPQNPGY